MSKQTERFYCSKHGLNHGQKYKSCHPKVSQTIPELLSQLIPTQRLADMILKEAKVSTGLAKRKILLTMKPVYRGHTKSPKALLEKAIYRSVKPPKQEVKRWEETFRLRMVGIIGREGKFAMNSMVKLARHLLEADRKAIRERIIEKLEEMKNYHEWASKHDNEIYDKIIDQVINVIKEVR